MQEFWNSVQDFLIGFLEGQGIKILQALVILLAGLIFIRLVRKIVRKRTLKNKKLDSSASVFIVSLVSVVLYLILAISVIKTLGFSTASIIAGFTTVALAVVLGLQDTMASITNGIIIIFTRPFKAGDFVDIAGTSGTVKDIRLFNTKLLTPDNIEVIIPNSAIVNATMMNYSEMSLRRADINIPCSHDEDVEKVKSIVLKTISAHPNVVSLPEPFCRVTNYDTSVITFTARAWVDNDVFWDTKFDLQEQILAALQENGVKLAFQKMDVRLVETRKEERV